MTITKTVIKLTHFEAFVKVVNDSTTASVTISLATDLKRADESLVGAMDVRLSMVEYGISSGGRIIRNGVNVLELPIYASSFTHDQCNDPTQKASDLVVTIGTGTVIIRLLKVSGFQAIIRPEQGLN